MYKKNNVPWNKEKKDCYNEDTIKKMSVARLNNPQGFKKGYVPTEEHIRKAKETKIKLYASGELVPANKGKKYPQMSKDRMGEGNPMYGKHSWNYGLKGYKVPNAQGLKRSDKVKEKFRIARLNYVKENPETNRINCLKGMLAGRKALASMHTKPELFIKSILDKCGLQEDIMYRYDKVLRTSNGYRFPDFRLTYKKIIIEADGSYWHRNKQELDAKRDMEFKELGYTTYHITEDLINNNPVEAMKQVVALI